MKSRVNIAALGILLAMGFTASATEFNSLPQKTEIPSKVTKREAPKGKTVYYSKECAGTAVLGNQIVMYEDVFPATLIWGADNEVCFTNILSTAPYETFVYGTFDGKSITVPTDQLVAEFEDADFGVCFGVYRTVPEGTDAIRFELDLSIESITFTVAEDGSMKMVLPGEPFDGKNPPEYVAGYYFSDDLSFTGFCDFAQEYTKLDLQLVTIPTDAEVTQYAYVDEFNFASLVDVAFDDDYLYIRGLSSMLPEGTLRARIEGDKAYIDQDEYLGVYYDMYYIFTKVLYDNPDYDEEDEESEPFIMAPADARFELKIDSDRKRIYADTDGVYLSYHCDENDFLNSLGYFGIFQLKYQESPAGIPANPVELEYHEEWGPMQGWNDFFFTLSNFSRDGDVLDVDKLYYKVFVDGEPLVFYQHTAENLNGEMVTVYPDVPIKVELLPYLFNNNEDIFKFMPNAFDIGIYTYVQRTIGVQSVYYYNDEFTYSDIVTLDLETGETTETPADAGIGDPESGTETVETEYYGLDGRRILNPGKGIYIRVDLQDDGSRISRKEIR